VTPIWEDVDASATPLTIIYFVSLMRYYFADNYTKLCTIEADLSRAPMLNMPKVAGMRYYKIMYDIILSFGMTELKAQVSWEENVSGLHLFNPTDFGFTLCVVLGKRETVSF
jgi:hypothetical protein